MPVTASTRQVEGSDPTSQAAADQKALDALNGFRRHMFGSDWSNVNKGPNTGQMLNVYKN